MTRSSERQRPRFRGSAFPRVTQHTTFIPPRDIWRNPCGGTLPIFQGRAFPRALLDEGQERETQRVALRSGGPFRGRLHAADETLWASMGVT